MTPAALQSHLQSLLDAARTLEPSTIGVGCLVAAGALWLTQQTGVLRPSTPDTTAGRRATGGTTPRSLRSKDAVGDTTTGGHHDTTGRAGGGARRMDTKDDDGADWAADEDATLEHSGGKEPPPRGWLVPDLVPHGPVPMWRWYWRRPTRARPLIDREVKGYTTVVIGSGGVGKSYLGVDLGIAALTGGTWLGKPVQRVKRVLYVDCELDSQTFWTRAYAVARGRWLERGKPPKGLHYLRLHASLASWAGQQQIREAVRKSKADLILVDSLTIGAHGLALADSNGWRRVYAGFERWGKPVVAIDHLGKEAGRGAVGSFMKQAMVRSALTMEREKGGHIKVEHSKTNFGPQVETFRVVSSFEGGTEGVPLTVSFTAVAPAAGLEPATTSVNSRVLVPTELRGKEQVRAYTAPPGIRLPLAGTEVPGPRTLAPQGAPPTTARSDLTPSARTHSVAPLPLPILTPPAVPADTAPDTAAPSPVLAWLQGQPDPTLPIPSRDIYAALGAQGMTLRACKVQLKALYEAGKVERSGQASSGYLYRARPAT